MQVSEGRVSLAVEIASAKALRQEQAWHIQGTGRRLVWLEWKRVEGEEVMEVAVARP